MQVVPPASPQWIGSTSQLTPTKLPGFAYPGGKKQLSKKIVAEMPPSGNNYVEPFAGQGERFLRCAFHAEYKAGS